MRIYGKSGLRKMNKYQEALDDLSYPLDDSSCGGCKCGESDCHCKKRTAVETLQELVDKATPKKPIPLFIPIAYLPYRCPICGTLVNHKKDKFNYCPKCGQAIDRSEEE